MKFKSLVSLILFSASTLYLVNAHHNNYQCNNEDIECCMGTRDENGTCECWDTQIFGIHCNYICRNDLCNMNGICDENSNPEILQNGTVIGNCICDNPQLSTNSTCSMELDLELDVITNMNVTNTNNTTVNMNVTNATNTVNDSNANTLPVETHAQINDNININDGSENSESNVLFAIIFPIIVIFMITVCCCVVYYQKNKKKYNFDENM